MVLEELKDRLQGGLEVVQKHTKAFQGEQM